MNADEIVEVFEDVFPDTRLCGGHDEPRYDPATGEAPATIRFREDFAASALHEVAHWCIAGRRRRGQPDFGYWYEPGRDAETQSLFEVVEARPQALEWIFSVAAGREFRVSFDSFDLPQSRLDAFRRRVLCAVHERLTRGLPPRARRFTAALAVHAETDDYLGRRQYEEIPC